jgi:predicted ABC-type ATPase
MVAEKSSVPTFWIIAGPNGSGKSTLYGSKRDAVYGNTIIADASRPFWIINPDLLASRIRTVERLPQQAANLAAVQRIETWLEASIDAHQSIGVETVLSTDKYRRLVRAAKERDYEVRLIYVILQSAELNVERVRLRVQKGGHNVPAPKVRERWTRSLDQLPWFLNQADWALLFDNSRELRVIGRKQRGVVELDPTAPADVRSAVEKIRSATAS